MVLSTPSLHLHLFRSLTRNRNAGTRLRRRIRLARTAHIRCCVRLHLNNVHHPQILVTKDVAMEHKNPNIIPAEINPQRDARIRMVGF